MIQLSCNCILLLFLHIGCIHQTNSEFLYKNENYSDIGEKLEGDILVMNVAREHGSKNALTIPNALWPEGIVPYAFHSNFPQSKKSMVLAAMRGLEKYTCVHFIPWTKQSEHILLTSIPKDGCYAMVGRYVDLGKPQPLNLENPGCFRNIGVIQHELLHVLGLFHEQNRPDRDKYVQIFWKNIPKKYWPDFARAKPNEVTTYDTAYGYNSIMHYPKDAFSKNGKPTIVAKKDPSLPLGQRDGPTKNDLLKICKMYKCPKII